MAHNSSFPANDGYLSEFPAGMREEIRALIEDMIVNALKLKGYSPGNASGNIPISNGSVCTGLNAEKLGGLLATAFALVGHVHALATGSSDGLLSSVLYNKLLGIATGAEVNQNAFANFLVNGTTMQADSKTDTLELVGGTGITLTADATNGRITIAVALATIFASAALTGVPTAPTATAGTNTTQIATTAFVQAATAALVASSPTTLDTLNELAAALGDDPNFATTMTNLIATKVPLSDVVTVAAANKILRLNASGVLPASITGNAATATTATSATSATSATTATSAGKLTAARTITLTGAVTGSVSTDLSGNVTIATTDGTAGDSYDAAHSFTTNGYQKLSNGLLIQWGTATSNTAITFPIAFPNGYLSISGSWVICPHPYKDRGYSRVCQRYFAYLLGINRLLRRNLHATFCFV